MIKRLTNRSWKQHRKNGDAPERVLLSKGFETGIEVVSEKQAEEDGLTGTLKDRVLQFTISTEAVDRDGDTIAVKGWDLKNFRRSGSVLWAHNPFEPPVARPVATFAEDNKLKSRAVFTPPEVYEFGDTIFRMYKGGFMRATSVGFLPKDFDMSEDESRRNQFGFPGVDFKKQELLEWSAVPVPANPEALLEASKSIDVRPLKIWVERVLDSDDSPGLWVPREVAEEMYASLKTVSTPKASPTGRGVDAETKIVVQTSTEDEHAHSVKFPEGALEEGTSIKTGESDGHSHQVTVDQDVAVGESATFKTSEVDGHTHSVTVEAGTESADADDSDDDGKGVSGDMAGYMEGLADTIKAAEDAESNALDGLIELVKSIAKRGRVLSQANENKLRDALKLIEQVLSAIKRDDPADDDDDDADDGKGAGDDDVVLKLVPEPKSTDPQTFDVDLESLETSIARQVHETLVTPQTGKVY